MLMDDVETFLLIASIGLCVMLIIIELVDLALFTSYRKEFDDGDGDNDDDL